MQEILLPLLGGGVAVSIIEGIREWFTWRRNRKAQKEDRAEQKSEAQMEERMTKMEHKIEDLTKMTKVLMDSQKSILFDQIKNLCRKYITDEEIDSDDLLALNALHNSYRNGLNGGKDLDPLMERVRSLPLKKKG